jgi:hypothetical protein
MPACTTKSLLEGNHREVNKKQQEFDSRGTKSAFDNRLGGWQARNKEHSRIRGSHDDRRNLDAEILGISKLLIKEQT